MARSYRFTSELWEWASRDNWFFVSLSAEASEEIIELPFPPRGFGSVPVRATIGSTTWNTSIFPGNDGRYTLPVKKAVRTAESIEKGDRVDVEVELIDQMSLD
ncbi:DUF1905 domain-containing protein [Glaciihabitans sp. UYNi722]|uniref:DUF1905 domain-containing protein n=1 Tax=Glaciihabitans sp. UYNi722 TaxID=3156344 RepID=UPI003393E734